MSRSVHRLLLARINLKGQYNPPTYIDTRIDVFGYLVISSSSVVLVDTGIGLGNQFIETTFNPTRMSVVKEIAQFGLTPADVDIVVNSHLHFDHCGNNKTFPNAQIFIQKHELEIACSSNYTVSDWVEYQGAKIESVDGDLEISPGITLIFTPGHTPGHQAILVDTAGGKVLIAAQAAFTAAEYMRDGDALIQAHEGYEAHYVQSISRLKTFGSAEVYFSHDANIANDSEIS